MENLITSRLRLFVLLTPIVLFISFGTNLAGQCNLGSITLNVNDAPTAELLSITCMGSTTYVVEISIEGGDPTTYVVSSSIPGQVGSISGPPYIYTSDEIPSGTPYQFTIFDANGCGVAIIEGIGICACETLAGPMDTTALNLCESETASASYLGGEVLDIDDDLAFVLHDNPIDELGFVYGENASPNFDFVPPLVLGQTYFISAVAGNSDGSGGVDFSDACLSVSFGTPVTWLPAPDGSLADDAEICQGDSALLTFSLIGDAPFDVTYSADSMEFMLTGLSNSHTITVSPDTTTTYTLVSIQDGSAAGCEAFPDSMVVITVNEHITENAMAEICEGESILLAGAMQTLPGIYADTLNTSAGCDSIILTTLEVIPLDTVNLTDTSCDPAQAGVFTNVLTSYLGCDSTVITTVSLLSSDTTEANETSCDPAQVGVFEEIFSNQFGCDSTVITSVTFSDADSTFFTSNTCDPGQAGVFVDIYTSQLGCDSVVTTTITLVPTDQADLTDTTCDPAQTGVFIEILTNQFGCDSTVTTTISLVPSDQTDLNDTSCDPAQAGVFTEILTNQFGCDSTVLSTIVFAESDTILLTNTSCDPVQTGVFTEILTGHLGCDSTVITAVSLLPSDTTQLVATSCDPAQVGTFEDTYLNQFGCDSTVISTVTFSDSDSTFFTSSTCDPAQAGIFVDMYTSQFGCDSIVTTTISLLPTDQVNLTGATCDPAQVGTFTEILTNQYGCDSTVTTVVSLLPSNQVNLTDTTCDPALAGTFIQTLTNQFGCDSTVITVVSLLPTDQTNLTETTCDPLQVGTFTETLTNQFGCDSVVITTTNLLPLDDCSLEFAVTTSMIPCGENEGEVMVEILQGTLPIQYSYTDNGSVNGSGDASTSPFNLPLLPAGTYSLVLTSSNGLSTSQDFEILQATPPIVTIEMTNSLACPGEMTGILLANVAGVLPPYSYLWSTGATTQEISNLGADIYEVTVSGDFDCTATAQMEIVEPEELTVSFVVSDPDCFDENGGFVEVDAMGGTPPFQYALNGGAFQDENLFPGLSAGNYQVMVMDGNGCEASESFAVNIPIQLTVELGDDLSIELGDKITLEAFVNLPDSLLESIEWTGIGNDPECPECLVQELIPLATTIYTISVETEEGCKDSDDMTVFLIKKQQVYLPSAFSPNGDGINDFFYPFANESGVLQVRSFLIFDRWGGAVHEVLNFQPNDETFGWDGMNRGEVMNPDVFVWFAEVEFIDGRVELFEGDVTLAR